MYTSRKHILVIIVLLCIGIACSPTDFTNHSEKEFLEQEVPESPGNLVNAELAEYAAEQFANTYNLKVANLAQAKASSSPKKSARSVNHILPKQNANGDTVAYLVNYQRGFAVVSSDKRMPPILAYSKKGKMPTNKDEPIPGGLQIWFGDIAQKTKNLQSAKGKGNDDKHQGWNTLTSPSPNIIEEPDPGDPGGGCEDELIEKGPLLQTTWGQADGYNNDAPYKSCNYPNNGKAYAGCVATAMAQVMRYHEYPNTYNWSIMPDVSINPNSSGSNEISELMRDVGNAVNMNYGCDGSAAADDDIEPGFRLLGYYAATQIGYEGTDNYENVIDNLDQGNPVVFTGYRDTDWGFIDKDGHAWVADGYRDIWDCSNGIGYLLFYMHWGWEGSENGWFYFNDFNPGDSQYNSGTEVVVNIHP